MVNVTHNTDNRRSCDSIFIILNFLFYNLLLNCNNNLRLNLCTKLGSNNFRSIVVDNLINSCHYTKHHKLFNYLGSSHTKHSRKITDSNFSRNLNCNLLLLSLLSNTCKTLGLGFLFGTSVHALWFFLSVLL